jgi:hypothetical protein
VAIVPIQAPLIAAGFAYQNKNACLDTAADQHTCQKDEKDADG